MRYTSVQAYKFIILSAEVTNLAIEVTNLTIEVTNLGMIFYG